MSVLSIFILIYLLISICIGLYVSSRVHNSSDYVVAGRSLPIYITIATVFATWFGSEAVLGIPATFIKSGLGGVVADPFGAGLCLIFVGIFFAARLYRMKLLTIGDFFRRRYNKKVELLISIAICISYLGWVSAQIVALGLVINLVSGGLVSNEFGMMIGISTVLIYTIFGGMWSVVITDFIQMIIILIGLIAVAWLVSNRFDGGAIEIIKHASANNKFEFWPKPNLAAILAFIGTFITLALGSIPQQDVFQRVMSAGNEKIAARGTVIGGSFYIIFCFVPIFITYGVVMLDPGLLETYTSTNGDFQRILPEFILNEVPLFIQILFFGALLSAIMSTASGTLLAPSAILANNIFKDILKLSDKGLLIALRICVLIFSIIVTLYAYLSSSAGLSIFEMVENAYLVTLCGAFVPFAFGVYWSKANSSGALLSIFLGVSTWIILEVISIYMPNNNILLVPPQLMGFIMAIIGMLSGSLFFTDKN
ncbi:sodium:solute symporter family protein [Rickettsiales bacterium]|nr:sodium:solute symporter family protein [Rickettsiales bacterium]